MGHFIFRKQTQKEIADQIIDCIEKKECVLLDIDLRSLGIAAPSVKRMTMGFYAVDSNSINITTTSYLDSNKAEWENISIPYLFLNQPGLLLDLINIQVVVSSV